jgi:hypothetical protein
MWRAQEGVTLSHGSHRSGAVGRGSIFDRRRMRMLGGETIVDEQHVSRGRLGQTSGQVPVRVDRADDIAPTV